MPDRDDRSSSSSDDDAPGAGTPGGPPDGAPSGGRTPRIRTFGLRAMGRAVGVVALCTLGLLILSGRMDDLVAQSLFRFSSGEAPPPEPVPVAAPEVPRPLAFREIAQHPDIAFRPYTAGPMLAGEDAEGRAHLIEEFRSLLHLYEQRQGTDGNFTVRVVDNRTDELLELFVLKEEQAAYEAEAPDAFDWSRIDRMRREHTRRLVDKYKARGIPNPAITVKWGRGHQVRQARRRDAPYIEYEIRLARYLGMSLLPTEIGTVETFNQDRLVSPVGARSRYQMMPYLLRQNEVHHYALPTAAGGHVQVAEEWHPLLVMEPAFAYVRANVNAVGHEIPGISAYHTGPGNIYMVYRRFLTHAANYITPQTTVMDAYMWALTEGYDTVSEGSSFGPYSRGYVASAYGALRATDHVPVDTSRTLLAERVRLKEDARIQLSHLLHTLGETGALLDWGAGTASMSLYDRFRQMNPHMTLPDGPSGGGVPIEGDVRLSARAEGVPVRFFLPLGARPLLQANGLDVIDEEHVFRFDHDAYPDPASGQKTMWDRQYDELIREIARFGFTHENRERLLVLADRFDALAEARPTHYRLMQQHIIQTHRRLWLSQPWEKLARATEAALGLERAPVRPPTPLDTATPSLSQLDGR